MRLIMESLRRLQQIKMVLQPQLASRPSVIRPYSVKMTKPADDVEFLQHTFSDINANLLTTEARCTEFMKHYSTMSSDQKGPFLCLLAQNYGIDKNIFLSVIKSAVNSKDREDSGLVVAADRMRTALRPKHKRLFTHLGRVEGGVKFLVDLRADVLTLKQSNMSELNEALYQELNSVLRELLLLWFTVGFLRLERITWNSPCDLVQKVANYEKVHRIRTWSDIKQRVGPYRRCFIFTHNSMPREPVVVLHTALTKEISSNIHSIIQTTQFRLPPSPPTSAADGGQDTSSSAPPSFGAVAESTRTSAASQTETLSPPASPDTTTSTLFSTQAPPPEMGEEKEDPSKINCAVFYSISLTQRGLQGIEIGNYLIKSAVKNLQQEFPHLQQFSSLSPIPGFRDWLLAALKHSISVRDIGEDPGVPLLLPNELSALEPYKKAKQTSTLDTFKDLLASHEWFHSRELTGIMVGPLMRLCVHYLYIQKRRGYALNPVANFHLSNGAVMWRINFMADMSHRGLLQSCTLMVNYRYFLDSTDTNSRNYLERQQIAASQEVLSLLRGPVNSPQTS